MATARVGPEASFSIVRCVRLLVFSICQTRWSHVLNSHSVIEAHSTNQESTQSPVSHADNAIDVVF